MGLQNVQERGHTKTGRECKMTGKGEVIDRQGNIKCRRKGHKKGQARGCKIDRQLDAK